MKRARSEESFMREGCAAATTRIAAIVETKTMATLVLNRGIADAPLRWIQRDNGAYQELARSIYQSAFSTTHSAFLLKARGLRGIRMATMGDGRVRPALVVQEGSSLRHIKESFHCKPNRPAPKT